MCYAKAYPWSIVDKIVVYNNIPQKLESELLKLTILPPFYISQVTDSLQAVEEVRKVTFQVVRILMKYRLSFRILTKSSEGIKELIETLPSLITYPYWYIAITIESPPEKQEITSPNASPISHRLKTLSYLSHLGISTVVRTDPTILGFVTVEEVLTTIQKVASFGVSHIVGALGTFNPISMKRLLNSIYYSKWRKCIKSIESIYGVKFEMLDDYPPWTTFTSSFSLRQKFHSLLRRYTERLGLTYSVCLELPYQYDSPYLRSCEDVGKNFVHIRKNNEFFPLPCSGDCLHRCPQKQNPPCKRKALQTTYPYKKRILR
jgi:DNA repair photolyase